MEKRGHRAEPIKIKRAYDIAPGSTCFYHAYVVTELGARLGVQVNPPDLQTYGEEFALQADKIAAVAFGSTAHIEEKMD